MTRANAQARELGGRDTDWLTGNSITVFFDASHGNRTLGLCELEFFGRDVHAYRPVASYAGEGGDAGAGAGGGGT